MQMGSLTLVRYQISMIASNMTFYTTGTYCIAGKFEGENFRELVGPGIFMDKTFHRFTRPCLQILSLPTKFARENVCSLRNCEKSKSFLPRKF